MLRVFTQSAIFAGPAWLAHKASHEGVLCVENIAGVEGVHPLDVRNVPGCTYCTPASRLRGPHGEGGERGGGARGEGRPVPLSGQRQGDRARRDREGFIKTVFDAKTGELLGAHMIGAEVTELIQGYGVAKTLETTEVELMHSIFPHPTLSEMMRKSVLDAYGRVIHI